MRLAVQAPFHLEATVRLLQRRPTNRVDAWEGARYQRVLRVHGAPFLCTVWNEGTIDAPRLHLSTEPAAGSQAIRAELERVLAKVLGLEEDPSFALGIDHPRLRALESALRGARPPRFPTLFEAFCRVIPYQQVSLESGGAITGRFVERFGQHVETPEGPLWAFPDAETIARAPVARFAGIGLSQHKRHALKEIANRIAKGALREEPLEREPSDAALRQLDALPGIGPWSAALVLLRGLRRMDVFPSGDVGAQRGLGELLGPRAPLATVLEQLGSRRGYLYFYSLGAQLLARGLIHPADAEPEDPRR